MLDTIPNEKEMTDLVGESLYDVWSKLCVLIDEKYDMDCLWDKGGKAWKYEYKYRRGGKTLCALYAREIEEVFVGYVPTARYRGESSPVVVRTEAA